MTVTVTTFREHYPEFADGELFTNPAIDYQIMIAGKLMNAPRWGDLLDIGTELFIAHNIALEAKAMREADAGGIPGGSVGIINSKSVDKVSVGYDTSSAIEPNAGHWNLTVYGLRFIKLLKVVGAGPIQIGGCASGPGAWPGPWQSNFPNPS